MKSYSTAKKRNYFFKQKLVPYAFITPGALIVLTLVIIPFFLSIYLAFTNSSITRLENYKWIGLNNFINIFNGPYKYDMFSALKWSIAFAALVTCLNTVLGFIIALLLNHRNLRNKVLFSTLLVIPWGVPTTIMMMVMQGIFLPTADYGVINRWLVKLGFPPVQWSYTWADGSVFATKAELVIIAVWIGYAAMMLYMLGSMKSIDYTFYEAAEIDGASTLQRIRHITIPFVYEIVFPIILVDFGFNFNNFDIVFLVTQGRPGMAEGVHLGGATDNLATLIYKVAFQDKFLFGMGAAFAIISCVIISVLVVLYYKFAGVKVEE